jgi:hypothetical protein
MCMTLAVSLGPVAVVACDTRWTVTTPDGTTHRHDAGQKLMKLSDGFLSGTGDGALMLAVGDAVRAAPATRLEDVPALLARLCPDPAPENTRLMGASTAGTEPRIVVLGPTGEVRQELGSGSYSISPPVELSEADAHALQRLAPQRLSRCTDVPDLLRAVCELFAFVAQRSDGISNDVDLGFLDEHGRGHTTRFTSPTMRIA